MAAETELKFRIAPRKLSSVLRSGGSSGRRYDQSEQSLVSTYYDTNKHKLRRHGLTPDAARPQDRGPLRANRESWRHGRPDARRMGA